MFCHIFQEKKIPNNEMLLSSFSELLLVVRSVYAAIKSNFFYCGVTVHIGRVSYMRCFYADKVYSYILKSFSFWYCWHTHTHNRQNRATTELKKQSSFILISFLFQKLSLSCTYWNAVSNHHASVVNLLGREWHCISGRSKVIFISFFALPLRNFIAKCISFVSCCSITESL